LVNACDKGQQRLATPSSLTLLTTGPALNHHAQRVHLQRCRQAISTSRLSAPAPQISNNHGISALGMVISFATVFRANLVWQRYLEALAQGHVMYSKLTDAFS